MASHPGFGQGGGARNAAQDQRRVQLFGLHPLHNAAAGEWSQTGSGATKRVALRDEGEQRQENGRRSDARSTFSVGGIDVVASLFTVMRPRAHFVCMLL